LTYPAVIVYNQTRKIEHGNRACALKRLTAAQAMPLPEEQDKSYVIFIRYINKNVGNSTFQLCTKLVQCLYADVFS